MTSDAIIYLPGIMGSELVDANGDVVWGARLGKFVRHLFFRDVLERIEPSADDGIRASRTIQFPSYLPFMSTMEPYTNLGKRLSTIVPDEAAVLAYPYDWRHSITDAAAKLVPVARQHLANWQNRFRELDPDVRAGLPEPKLTLVGHSMGGLVASQYLTAHQGDGAENVRQIVTLGTPFRGSLDAVQVLATGKKLPFGLFSESLRASAQKMPGLYELIAHYKAVDDPSGPRALTPADIASIGASEDLAASAFATTATLMDKVDALPAGMIRCLAGTSQPTLQSVRIIDGVPKFEEHLVDADGNRADHRGDGTVFRYAATPKGVESAPIPQGHGALARVTEGTEFATHVATARDPGAFLGDGYHGLRVPDVAIAGEPFDIEVISGSEADAVSGSLLIHEADSASEMPIDFQDLPIQPPTTKKTISIATPGLHRVSLSAGSFSPVEASVLVVESD